MHLPESSELMALLPPSSDAEVRSEISCRWRSAFLPLVATVLLIATIHCGSQQANGQIQPPVFGRVTTGEEDPMAGVYLPTDRALSRALIRARERVAQHEYQEALTFLHGVLGREEDWFFEGSADETEQRGVKATARQLIGSLPKEGLDAYELLHGATARRELEAAINSGSRAGLSQVVRKFFHTNAGYEAALVLAQMESDQGHRLAAAQLFQDLIDTPRAAALFEPQLSMMAAVNQLAGGQREAAAKTLQALIQRSPAAEVSVANEKILLPGADADLAAWLTEQVGEPSIDATGELNWLTSRGEPSRNARTPGGRPHLRPRWQSRVVNDPANESYLAGRTEDYLQRGVAVIPVAKPIAVGDVVVMRTPENVVAVDFQSGKRIWETREDDELEAEDRSAEFPMQMEREQWGNQVNPLEERVWDDALVMSLSSDGERVFVLRGVALAEEENVMGWQMGPGGFGRGGGQVTATTNQLAAYDMATQGKLAWELDGSRAPAPLDGAFFLGAPVAIDNTLYVMAEIRSAIYLFALDPATGKVQWQQQLIGLEQSVGLDPLRRRAGATPSYDAGILVCPTGANTVIAIDVVKREFAWVYKYAREAVTPAEMRNNIWQNQIQGAIPRDNDRWLDNVAVIGEGRVFLTPPESNELHCVDLRSGKLAWKHRQNDALFVAGVDRGHVLLVGAEKIQALRVADGTAAWQQESVSLPAKVLPSGQGYLSEGSYYLPLTSGEIAAIDTATGELTLYPAAGPGAALGNLICHRGSVLSQSVLLLDKYEQLNLLQRRVEKALAANEDDPIALREFAELKRTEGKRSEAVKFLKQAWELAPDDASTREMLTEVLLEALDNDYTAFKDDVPLLGRLVDDRGQQIELMRLEARGLDQQKDRLAAFDAYLRLADFTAEGAEQLRVYPGYSVRSDRWISGRLGELWSAATDAERQKMLAEIESRRPQLAQPRTAAELRHYLAHASELPGANQVRQALASLLIDRKRDQDAEIEILELAASSDVDRAVTTKLTNKLNEAFATSTRGSTTAPWPTGKVKAELIPAASSGPDVRAARLQAERQAGYRQLRIEQDTALAPSSLDWFVAMDCSELVARNALGDDVFHLPVDQNNWSRPFRDSNFVHAGRLGRVLYVTLGGQIMAINSPSGSANSTSEVLWQTDPFGRYSGESLEVRRASGEPTRRAIRRPVYHAWSGRKRMPGAPGASLCSLGPVTPQGVVFQERDELKCVDPLSGELLWARNDIPVGCELLGDSEHVLAADVGRRVAQVIRMVDGQIIGTRELPKQEWLLCVGTKVAEIGFKMSGEPKALAIRVSDLLSGEVLFEQDFAIASRVSVLEPHEIAVFEPLGKFRLIDVRTGQMTIDEQLESFTTLHAISTKRAGDKLFLMVSGPENQQFKPLVQQPDFPMINGHVYAFDGKSGKPLWPTPAVVRNRGMMLSQPEGIPLLVFADRKLVRDPATGGVTQLRLLCIDQETGQTVYRNDTLPDTSITRFRIRGERDAGAAVAVEMNAGKILLSMTDEPRPPQPPANDDLEALPEIAERGLRGIGRRITDVLRDSSAENLKQRQKEAIEERRRRVLEMQKNQLRQLQNLGEQPEQAEPPIVPEPDDD